ncbi:MAG: DcaP family trimeric outer membrane transporter [Pseudomonadota bacterium]
MFRQGRPFFLRNGISVLFLLVAAILMASPAAAFDFDVKGTDVSVGGYLKLMMIYDTGGRVDTGPFDGDLVGGYDPPLDGTPNDDKQDFRMTARESRLFVKTKTKTDLGVLKTHFEGDFYGGSDVDSETWSSSTSYRLRHAYGSLDMGNYEVTAGQTWSTFMDLAAGVPDMDVAGDPGFTFVRQPMVKFQYNLRPGHYLAVAIENPDRGLTAAGPVAFFSNPGNSEEKLPDFVLKHFYATKAMTFSARGVFRQFDLTDTATGKGDSAMAWGLGVSGSYKTGPVRFMGTFMYGDGLGRYGGLGNIGGAGLTAANEVETVGFMSANAGITLALSDKVNWTIGAGWAENDDDAYKGSKAVLTASATKTAIGYHTNVKWEVTPGLEWAIGAGLYHREVMDGREGEMLRFQSYFQYTF